MRLWRDRRGGAGLVAAGMMPILVGFAAFAVDLGAVQLDTRRLQGIADAAALAAASAPTGAAARAHAVIDGSRWPRTVTRRIDQGIYSTDPAVVPGARFIRGAANPDAVHVMLESDTPTFFARIFGMRDVAISRHATARRQRFAAFSIGSRLASMDGGILNAYLGALTGSEVKLSLMDYYALASADVDLVALLPLVRTSADLDAVTFDDILTSHIATPKLLDALALALTDRGQLTAATAIRSLASVSGGQSVSLSALLDLGPIGSQAVGGTGLAHVDALALATAILQIASPKRQASLDLGASVPGLTNTKVIVAVGERTQQSPWVTITDSGVPIVRTAQARVYLRTTLAPVSVPGLGTAVSINVPILLELASAQARLASIDCATGARSVSLEGRTDIGSAAIGTVNEAQITDFSSALQPAPAKLVEVGLGLLLPVASVTANTRISLGAAEQWQKIKFSETDIANGTRKTIGSSTPLTGVPSSLIGQTALTPSVLGLQLPVLGALVSAVGAALKPAALLLDPLLMTITGTLGVGIGEADLKVTGMRCGQAVLVA